MPSEKTAERGVPEHGWTMFAGLARPKSRGRISLSSSDPKANPNLHMNALSDPEDFEAALACIKLCREIGNAPQFEPLVTGEAMPGNLDRDQMAHFVRDSAVTYWHQSGSAKTG